MIKRPARLPWGGKSYPWHHGLFYNSRVISLCLPFPKMKHGKGSPFFKGRGGSGEIVGGTCLGSQEAPTGATTILKKHWKPFVRELSKIPQFLKRLKHIQKALKALSSRYPYCFIPMFLWNSLRTWKLYEIAQVPYPETALKGTRKKPPHGRSPSSHHLSINKEVICAFLFVLGLLWDHCPIKSL